MVNEVAVVGHRANSWRVISFYRFIGVPIVEIDVCPGSNGELLVKHGPSEVKRASLIGKMFSYIDYKLFYRDPLIKASTLENHLKSLSEFSGVLFDIKRGINLQALANIIDRMPYEYNIEYAYVSTPYHPMIRELKELTNRAIVAATLHDLPVDPVSMVLAADADAVSANYTLLSEGLINLFHMSGIKVFAWTINDCKLALSLVDMGVDAIITDRPDMIMKCLRKHGIRIKGFV